MKQMSLDRISGEIKKVTKELRGWHNAGKDKSLYTGQHAEWRNWMAGETPLDVEKRGNEGPNEELVTLIDDMASRFAAALRQNLKDRFKPYMHHYDAMALIDLRLTKDKPRAKEGFVDLCGRWELDADAIRDDIRRARIQYGEDDCVDDRKVMKENLYKFHYDNRAHFLQEYPALYEYQAVVFTLPYSTTVVESLFSRMNGTKTKIRSRLLPSRVNATIHCHDAKSVLDNVKVTAEQPLPMFTGVIELDYHRTLQHTILW